MSATETEKLNNLSQNYQLELILMFGSMIKGDIHPESDVDIAVYSRHILSEKEKIDLTNEFGDIFQSDRIDLVDIKTAPPFLKKKIFDDYKVLFFKNSFLLYQLELASIYELKEAEIFRRIRHERIEEFVR